MSLVALINQITYALDSATAAQGKVESAHSYADTDSAATVQLKSDLESAAKNLGQAVLDLKSALAAAQK